MSETPETAYAASTVRGHEKVATHGAHSRSAMVSTGRHLQSVERQVKPDMRRAQSRASLRPTDKSSTTTT